MEPKDESVEPDGNESKSPERPQREHERGVLASSSAARWARRWSLPADFQSTPPCSAQTSREGSPDSSPDPASK